jgi:hypothetical protein
MKTPKPHPWPFYIHCNGQYAKKIGGKHVYFGVEYHAALRKYYNMLDGGPATLKSCIKKYLASRERLQESGEITRRHVLDMEYTLDGLSDLFGSRLLTGLGSEDFGVWRANLAKTNGPVSLSNHIARVRIFLNWCKRERIITDLPPGDALRKPSKAQLRKARSAKGSMMFEPEELRTLLKYANPQLKAMILLALNCGLGNKDISLLAKKNVKGGVLDFPRNKTGIERKGIPLWLETIKAIDAVTRPDDDFLFRTKYGNLWGCKGASDNDSPIASSFRKLCKELNLYKQGRNFYSLRHVTQTIAEEMDPKATEYIMGHCPASNDMSAVYRERMSKDRLSRVVEHIRQWVGLDKHSIELFATTQETPLPVVNLPIPITPTVNMQ